MSLPHGRRGARLLLTCTLAVAAAAALPATAGAVVAGAGFTTFDAALLGCLDSPNGINCNHYTAKDRVYMSGGPSQAGLSDGTYFFAVLTPGSQSGAFVDGADGNLSDTTAGATAGDAGGGDDVSNRTFTVSSHQVSGYGGTHAQGTSPNGRPIIALAPFDDTDNPGGVYILAICRTGATTPSGCKYDAFKAPTGTCTEGCDGDPFGVVSGAKYYDVNHNGMRDPGEVGLPNWAIDYHDGVADTILTDANGDFSTTLIADDYTILEQQGPPGWVQTGNTVDQTDGGTGGTFATLNADMTYSATVTEHGAVSGLNFGNVCTVTNAGGHTLGFWSNKNGQATLAAADPAWRALLNALHLVKANGTPFAIGAGGFVGEYKALRAWLLDATATNMSMMLSAQLAATVLNVAYNGQATTGLVNVGGTWQTIGQTIADAVAFLAANPVTVAAGPQRTRAETLKNVFDALNNNVAQVTPVDPAACPPYTFG